MFLYCSFIAVCFCMSWIMYGDDVSQVTLGHRVPPGSHLQRGKRGTGVSLEPLENKGRRAIMEIKGIQGSKGKMDPRDSKVQGLEPSMTVLFSSCTMDL